MTRLKDFLADFFFSDGLDSIFTFDSNQQRVRLSACIVVVGVIFCYGTIRVDFVHSSTPFLHHRLLPYYNVGGGTV